VVIVVVNQIVLLPLAVVILAVRYWRGARSRPVPDLPRARMMLRIAIVMLWANVLFWSVMGLGQLAHGDSTGVGYLVPALLAAILTWLVMRRPAEGAVVLIGLGGATTAWYLWPKRGAAPVFELAPLILWAMPFLIPGLLIWLAYESEG
jgi:hypothetical protein